MKNNLVKIKVINPRALGRLNGVEVFVTKGLEQSLTKQKTRDGNLFELFKNGRALRGFKHLIQVIKTKNGKAKIIFSDGETKRTKNEFRINFEDYRKVTQAKFYVFYRETGLDSANFFLNSRLPKEFDYDKGRVTESQLKKVDNNFPKYCKTCQKKPKTRKFYSSKQ